MKRYAFVEFYALIRYVTIVFAFCFLSCKKPKADLLIYGAKIYTVNQNFDTAEAIVIQNGRILAVGSLNELRNKYSVAEEVDYTGKFIYPGLIDAHCHFFGLGQTTQQIDLMGTRSWQEVIERCKSFYAQHPGLTSLTGRGWDQNDWEVKEYPTNDELNKSFPEIPVLLKRVDGHAAIANDKTLAIAGIIPGSNIAGGELISNKGKLTGILIDNAVDKADAAMPKASRQNQIEVYAEAEKICIGYGLTSLHDAGQEIDLIQLLDSLQLAGKININVYQMVSATPANIAYYLEKGPYHSGHLTINSFKLYGDGALGSRGACLLQPYSDLHDHSGFLLSSPAEIEAMVKQVAGSPFQLNTHCIGDSANRFMLSLYSKYVGQEADRRWRIEHSQVINAQDFGLFAKYKVIPSVQPTHATSDMYWAKDRLGEEREKGAYAYKQLLQQNGWLPLGTDFPIEYASPYYTFYAAVSRQDAKGYPEGGYYKEQALTREEALKGMTLWAAKAAFEEAEKGSIEVGKRADLTILDVDLMHDDLLKIRKTKAAATFISGKKVF
jgi:predicted amidohydrolase YtcJ